MKKDDSMDIVFVIAILGFAGYWAYNKYFKSKVETYDNAKDIFGFKFF
jgi:multisubunit Na+/H+ antiporter MnhF subunit